MSQSTSVINSRAVLLKAKSEFLSINTNISLLMAQFRHTPHKQTQLKTNLGKLAEVMSALIDILDKLADKYISEQEVDKLAKIHAEMDRIDKLFIETEQNVTQVLSCKPKSIENSQINHQTTSRPNAPLNVNAKSFTPKDSVAVDSPSPFTDTELKQLLKPRKSLPLDLNDQSKLLEQIENDTEKLEETFAKTKINSKEAKLKTTVPKMNTFGLSPSHLVNSSTPVPTNYSFDPTRLLTRVQVPKFEGDKRNFESWKAAFTACVHCTDTSPEYKLLRLRDCLKGEPLNVIASLGHSAAAYDVAMAKLERKYGGHRRQISLRLEELHKFRQIRENNAKYLEQLSELLDVIAVNLIEADKEHELGAGALYLIIQKKMNESLLAKFHRWVFYKGLTKGVQVLRTFINLESEFLTTAHETVQGFSKNNKRNDERSTEKAYLIQASRKENSSYRKTGCSFCGGAHGI